MLAVSGLTDTLRMCLHHADHYVAYKKIHRNEYSTWAAAKVFAMEN